MSRTKVLRDIGDAAGLLAVLATIAGMTSPTAGQTFIMCHTLAFAELRTALEPALSACLAASFAGPFVWGRCSIILCLIAAFSHQHHRRSGSKSVSLDC